MGKARIKDAFEKVSRSIGECLSLSLGSPGSSSTISTNQTNQQTNQNLGALFKRVCPTVYKAEWLFLKCRVSIEKCNPSEFCEAFQDLQFENEVYVWFPVLRRSSQRDHKKKGLPFGEDQDGHGGFFQQNAQQDAQDARDAMNASTKLHDAYIQFREERDRKKAHTQSEKYCGHWQIRLILCCQAVMEDSQKHR